MTKKGIEISAQEGSPIRAVSSGNVVYADWLKGYGLVVIVDHTNGFYSLYAHASKLLVASLRIELAGTGVSVTVAAPDFVLSEIHRRAAGPDGRPLGASPMQESRIMTAERCARIVLDGAARRQRLVATSARGRLLPWLRLLAPGLVDRMAARAIRERH